MKPKKNALVYFGIPGGEHGAILCSAQAGHSLIMMTRDIYGHLWQDKDANDRVVSSAERRITE